jgi:hypothetical protein
MNHSTANPSSTDRIRKWTPRVLAALFAAFISIFAADVFDEQHGFWNIVVALAIHLIPTWIVLALLVASWRRALVGAIAFPALGALYVVWAWGRFPWSTYAVISGPLFVLGALYAAAWRGRMRTPAR